MASEVKRVPVDFDFSTLNWDFLKEMAKIAHRSQEKYGSTLQYTEGRLEGEKSPINHIADHTRAYLMGEEDDMLGGAEGNMAKVAYNAMIEWFYYRRFGPIPNPLAMEER